MVNSLHSVDSIQIHLNVPLYFSLSLFTETPSTDCIVAAFAV